jgi:hypothetical protein
MATVSWSAQSSDLNHFTPYIKALLTKRNRLRKRGKVAYANKPAGIINLLIAKNMHNRLSKLVDVNRCGVRSDQITKSAMAQPELGTP